MDFEHYSKITQNLCLDAGYVEKTQTVINNGMTPHIRVPEERKRKPLSYMN